MTDDRALADAIRRHEERLARDPESLAFAQLADLYRKAGRTGDAVTLCREGLHRWPHYTTARLILAKTLLAEGQLEPALAEMDAILQTSPKDVQCLPAGRRDPPARGPPRRGGGSSGEGGGLDPGDRESNALLALLRADTAARGGRRPGPGAERRHVRHALLRHVVPGPGPGRRGGAGAHPRPRPECPTMPRRASGWKLRCGPAHDGEGEQLNAGVDRGIQEGTANRLRRAAVRHRRFPARQARQGRRLRAHQAQAHAAGQGHRQHLPLGEKVELVEYDEKHMQFLYKDDRYNFMDTETYEQVSMSADEVGDARDYLKENIEVDVLYIDGSPDRGRAAELRRAGHRPHRSRRPRRHRPGRHQTRHAGDRRRRPGAALPQRGRRGEGRHAHRRVPRPRRRRPADGQAAPHGGARPPCPPGATSESSS